MSLDTQNVWLYFVACLLQACCLAVELRLRFGYRFSVRFVSGYAHVFELLSVVVIAVLDTSCSIFYAELSKFFCGNVLVALRLRCTRSSWRWRSRCRWWSRSTWFSSSWERPLSCGERRSGETLTSTFSAKESMRCSAERASSPKPSEHFRSPAYLLTY